MKTKSEYFPIKIHAKDIEELNKRIADNESRGFELVAIYSVKKRDHVYRGNEYGGSSEVVTPMAMMRRKNWEVTE